MPWSYAVKATDFHSDHQDLAGCHKILSDVPGDTPDNLRWDNPVIVPSIEMIWTLTGSFQSLIFDPDFGWFSRDLFTWDFFTSDLPTRGSASFQVDLQRGDGDLQTVDVSWTGKALFDRVTAFCLGHDLPVSARAECAAGP